MPEYSAPLKEVARMLDLVPYLSTHSFISLKTLADEFGVTEKEMTKELTALSMCGLPGYTPYELIEVFFESGFVTINNHEPLDMPRALSFSEIATLLLGLEILRDSIEDEMPGVSAEIDSLVKLLSGLSGGVVEAEADSTIATISELNRAISNRLAISISYHSTGKDEVSVREIEPLEILTIDGYTYLNAFCRLSQSFRRFRTDRIEILKFLGSLTHSQREVKHESEVTVVDIEISSNRRANSEQFGIKNFDPSGRASLPVFSEDWLIRNVLAAGGDVTVVGDGDICSEIRLTAAEVLALYS